MRKYKHHSYFATDSAKQAYLLPNVCFACRKSFRRPKSEGTRKCPDCGGVVVALDRKFKAPRKGDLNAWRVVQYVVDSGLRYQSIRLGDGKLATYPRTMRQAVAFVGEHGQGMPLLGVGTCATPRTRRTRSIDTPLKCL